MPRIGLLRRTRKRRTMGGSRSGPTTASARLTSASKTLGKNGTSSSDSSLFSLEWLCNAMPPNHEEVKRHQENKQPRDQQNVTGEEPPECISIVSPPENAR